MSFFPCTRCGWMPRNCTCVRDARTVTRLKDESAQRHATVVARTQRWDTYRKAAA